MQRMARFTLVPVLLSAAFVVAVAPGAGAATISPTFWDFGTVGEGASSATHDFVTTGESGDNFTGSTSLLGYYPDEFKVVSDGCTGKHITNGVTCSVGVAFVPSFEIEGDLDATLYTQPYTGLAGQYHADLLGHTAELGEGGGGKRGGGPSPAAKKKCKKIKNKSKRKKCLKKQGAGGR